MQPLRLRRLADELALALIPVSRLSSSNSPRLKRLHEIDRSGTPHGGAPSISPIDIPSACSAIGTTRSAHSSMLRMALALSKPPTWK